MKVPCAATNGGNLIFPADAVKKRKYDCIECGEKIIVKRGCVKVAHFAHLPGAPNGCGGGESMVHRSTKEWIAQIAASLTFVVWTTCIGCGNVFDVMRGSRDMDVCTEWSWQQGQYILDVALARNGHLCGVVEVWHTHEAGETKRKTIEASSGVPCPVMEIRAIDLITTNYPRRFECVSPRRCSKCLAQAMQRKQLAMRQRYDTFFKTFLFKRRREKQIESIITSRQTVFDVTWAAVQELKTILAVEAAVDAIAAATERIARRWLLLIRVRHLTAMLKCIIPCGICGAAKGTWCWCNKTPMSTCDVCKSLYEKRCMFILATLPKKTVCSDCHVSLGGGGPISC